MAIISIPPREIRPTKARNANLVATGTSGVFYTAVDLTGRGTLNFVDLFYYVPYNIPYAAELHYKITNDGVVDYLINLDTEITMYDKYSNTEIVQKNGFNSFTNMYFYKSLKVEVMQISSYTRTLNARIHFSLE